MTENKVHVIPYDEFDFKKLRIDPLKKSKVSIGFVNYEYPDGVEAPLICQFPPLVSGFGLSYYEQEDKYTFTYDLFDPEGQQFAKTYAEKFDTPLLQVACGPKRREWFPKTPNSESGKQMILSQFASCIDRRNEAVNRFKAKVNHKKLLEGDGSTRVDWDVGGWFLKVDPESQKIVSQQKVRPTAFRRAFQKGVYCNTHRMTSLYIGGKGWGISWAVVDISRILDIPVPDPPKLKFGGGDIPTTIAPGAKIEEGYADVDENAPMGTEGDGMGNRYEMGDEGV